ncbi:23S rRNA (adenine(2030)-N(6))-methyltransferase RlmJ [Treponema sp. C6A8]|uniref:23S rRNA (adenine(2030)-N(6))-methyltransferase RlmJ n=1 Tax=Treponema sp. C6A8 TaxID=1410609 RepID=UPI000685424B|nr:23S rRNA (adenine(2030)-N(6))-methyltransferase RlmJ [Treponema sp. C6A8]
MLSYQHAFHAGNHADILKHLTLFFVLSSLNKKDKPYTYFDTHSGSGLYDLLDNRSQKTGEAEKGISRLISSKMEISGSHSLLSDYISLIDRYYFKNFYPGSPEIARVISRQQDFIVLSELHPQEVENLKKNMLHPEFEAPCKNVQVHNRNGFEMLKALTPPKTKRGAVLIDPSYEEVSDYTDCAKTITAVNKKWTNGIIMLWYPLLSHREQEINQMLNDIQSSARSVNPNTEICDLRLEVAAKDSHQEMSLKEYQQSEKNPPRLYGSGMLVLNAPWHLKEDMEKIISVIENLLK